MQTIRVGGHTYTDPDVLSLIEKTGKLVDPRSAVLTQARQLIARFRQFEGSVSDSTERLTIIASLLGMRVQAMDIERQRSEKRDAVLINTPNGRVILYNPRRPKPRAAFSIAHEIVHTFFPNSMSGARFRSICASDSKEANELERLCDLGAAELLMPMDEFQLEANGEYGIASVNGLCEKFGSSFESTVFRLATAHPGLAIAGLLKFRLTVGEQRGVGAATQRLLFEGSAAGRGAQPVPRYRRQSLFLSEKCGPEHIIRWNKSFDEVSCVYRAGRNGHLETACESLPNQSDVTGQIEALRAPFQRPDADEELGDVLFFWQLSTPR